jgi:hypothetical protein
MPEQWQMIAAARMTRTLASKPRNAKTRAYLETLPKRAPVVVSPSDYPLTVTRAEARLDAMLQALRDADWERRGKPPSPSLPARRDRLRPRCRAGQNDLRHSLFVAQGGLCSICGAGIGSPFLGTIEHVTPRALGGGNVGNRLLAHETCNNRKGCSPPTVRELALLETVNALMDAQKVPA